LACDSQTATWPTEVVTWTVTAGVPYWIFVDGSYNGTAYSPHYDLVIAAP
jgi:hypothetical protein